jgi:hypothetical protein
MALTLEVKREDVIGLDEYVDYVEHDVELREAEGIAESAPMFKALLNNRRLITDLIDRELRTWYDFQRGNAYSGETLMLATRPDFYVRANIWAEREPALAAIEKPVSPPYTLLHDHNFTFLTGGYFGPGYATTLYEVDPSRIEGFTGERVDLEFLEHTVLSPGKVMLYRAGRDVHVQEHAPALSISLNLVVPGKHAFGPQYYFDAARGTITGRVENEHGRSIALCELARHVGGSNTVDLLDGLARKAISPAVRRAAAAACDELIQTQGYHPAEPGHSVPEPHGPGSGVLSGS